MVGAGTPRERYRGEVRTQIKRLAETQLDEQGAASISLAKIARELGMSGPALYRYYPSRDALLGEMIADAYNDLADALEAGGEGEPSRRFLAAYREWGRSHPQRYRLLFQPPVPGFDANEPALVGAAQRSMRLLIDALTSTQPQPECVEGIPGALSAQLDAWLAQMGLSCTQATALSALRIWSWVHGFVSLEIAGNLALIAPNADELFEAELAFELR